MYISDTQSLDRVLPSMLSAPILAIDTEFMRERTYFARLCLIQIATPDEVFLIDAIALGDGVARLAPVLTAPGSVKVFHAGQQDLEILLRATGSVPAPVFDTQVAATLAGFPVQVGYGQLAKELLGVDIDKGDTFTDWAARPLSDTQLQYAEGDVTHLVKVYELLHERLVREKRMDWLAEDFERMADPATYAVDPRAQYLRVKRMSTLDRRGLGVLREVAAWRETEAQRRDIPKRWLVSDESLVEIARRRPHDAKSLGAIRGVSEKLAAKAAVGVLEAVRTGEAVPDSELPILPKRDRTPRDAQPIADVLSAVMRVRAREHGVAATLFASRDELERFAAGDREGHPLSSGWRHALVGAELEAILDGKTVISVKDGRMVLSAAEGADDGS